MSNSQDLMELKNQVDELRAKIQTVTESDWEAYVKVRDILTFGSGLMFGGSEGITDSAASGGATAFFGKVVRCAMVGIFEPTAGAGSIGGYDAGAVERFADLGE